MDLQIYFVILILLLVSYLFYKMVIKKDFWTTNGIHKVKTDSMFSRLWNGLTFVDVDRNIYKNMGNLPYAGFTDVGFEIFIVKDMEWIRKILVKDFEHFVNRRTVISDDVSFKHMLFFKADQEWKDLRSTMSPTFTTGKIRKMFPIFNDTSKKLIDYLKNDVLQDKPEGGEVDMEDVLGRYCLDVIASAAFGIDSEIFKNPDSTLARMSKKMTMKFNFLTIIKFLVATVIPFSSKLFNLRILNQEADEYMSNLVRNTIKYRESTGEKRNDFLQLMMEVKSGNLEDDSVKDSKDMDLYDRDAQLLTTKKKIQVDDTTVIANCVGFLLAGFDSINTAITFSAYALALNPQIQEKLRLELEKAAEANSGDLSYDVVNQHEYLDKVINESLRMYPPTARTERKCTKDYTLDEGVILKKDTIVAIPVYPIHHDETYFPNPEVFDPERFSVENKAQRSPYAFMPFGHGPRNCIANRFALTESKAAIASLVMNFEISPCAKSPIPLKFANAISLKAKGGMWLKLKSRK